VPEGDTVWRTARQLDRALSGCTVTGSDFRVPAHAGTDLSGQPVVGTHARGKHLLTRIGGDDAAVTLHTHLAMEGSWHLYLPRTTWRRPAHQVRVVLSTADWTAVGFSLGVVQLLPRADEGSVVGHLGPDLLGPDWDEHEAVRRLAADPDRAVAQALLDQRNLAGLGNLYTSELCFLLGLSPWLPVAQVPDLVTLVGRARAVLDANKERAEQTTTGDLRRGRRRSSPHGRRAGSVRPTGARPASRRRGAADPPGMSSVRGSGGRGHHVARPGAVGDRSARDGGAGQRGRVLDGHGHGGLLERDRVADLGEDLRQRDVERRAEGGQQLGGRLLLTALDLGDVAQAHPGVRGDLTEGASLAHPLRAEHLAEQSTKKHHAAAPFPYPA
jgi:endonuclease-8